ncbi:MAG: nickel pincer cofactor biosynthesis protein LarC [Clostridiales bacterium]|nr:nickel pincer cofactor biosynthesis protein LarC [Clostridiales bacterium]
MKETILYLDCSSGISGDMTVAALLDLGADCEVLERALKSLPLSGYSIEIKDVYKSGIRACDFHVILDAEHENHDHDMAYLHGNDTITSTHTHEHTHGDHECSDDDHGHSHGDHEHAHGELHHGDHIHGDHHHAHHVSEHVHSAPDHIHGSEHAHDARNLQDIVNIIQAGDLSATAADLAVRIFEIVAKAEAKVHGKEIHEVHFHEVGAVDSIVDIVAAAVCLDNLHPDQVAVSALTEGCGQIRCQHGLIPVPVPAVTAIAEQEGLVLRLTDIQGELVTPTGAAIAAAIRTREALPEQFRIRRVGLGAGKRAYATAGLLRAMLLEPVRKEAVQTYPFNRKNLVAQIKTVTPDIATNAGESLASSAEGSTNATGRNDTADSILILETNIDDCTGEALSFTMEQLFAAGALDVFSIPIYMKKNRPAYLLKTLCNVEDQKKMEEIIFQNTTTIGIRRQIMQRTKLSRRIVTIETDWGIADIKCCECGSLIRYFPENDSVSRLAAENGIGFPDMYQLLQQFAQKHLTAATISS